eukprot:6465922-Amphidinium_carterae.1
MRATDTPPISASCRPTLYKALAIRALLPAGNSRQPQASDPYQGLFKGHDTFPSGDFEAW